MDGSIKQGIVPITLEVVVPRNLREGPAPISVDGIASQLVALDHVCCPMLVEESNLDIGVRS